MLNPVLEVFASDGERSDSLFCHCCKLQANGYHYLSDNSSDLINFIILIPAQKYKHSQQFTNNSRNDGVLFLQKLCRVRVNFPNFMHCTHEIILWHCGGKVSSQLHLFYVMLFLHILYAIKTLISDRVLELNPYSTSSAR